MLPKDKKAVAKKELSSSIQRMRFMIRDTENRFRNELENKQKETEREERWGTQTKSGF